MHSAKFPVAFLLLVVTSAAPAQAPPHIQLFSAEEAAMWNAPQPKAKPDFAGRELPHPGVPSCHAIPEAAPSAATDPQIKIAAPALDKPLISPLTIDLQFIAAGGAHIRPDTFRVCYMGFVTVDITKRITERVSVSAQGLHVAGAELPHGHHRLMLLIADEQGHFGKREATFDIQ